MKKVLSSPKVILSIVGGIAVLAVIYVFITSSSHPSNQFVTVTRENVVEAVTSPGTVKAAESIDLGFERGGRISSVNAQEGDTVTAGEVIATVDSSDVYAQYSSAKAALAGAQATYASLASGARPEVVALDETAISNAQTTSAADDQSVRSTLQDAYNKSDDAVHNQVDQFMINGRGQNPTLNFNVNDQQLTLSIQNDRVTVEAALNKWQSDLASVQTDSGPSLDADVIEGKADLTVITNFLTEVGTAVNSMTPTNNPNIPTATQATYKADITQARSNISTDLSALISAETARANAEAALTKTNQQLTLDQAGATPDQLAAQQALVDAAQSTVNLYAAELGQAVITAPINGVITVQNAHVGAIASPGVTEVSMNSTSQFQVESFLSETDIAKVKVGDTASVTLDSYPGMSPLAAAVIAVDPAATVTNGISAYKTTLQFAQNDDRVKAGLTASVSINAGSASSTLVVPQSAIITQGDSKYVLKQVNNISVLTPVQVGISDPSGVVEIISGLNEGDRVAAFGNAATQ